MPFFHNFVDNVVMVDLLALSTQSKYALKILFETLGNKEKRYAFIHAHKNMRKEFKMPLKLKVSRLNLPDTDDKK